MPFPIGALALFAKAALTTVIGPFVEEAREAALNAAQDAVRGVVSGKMSIGEWAEIVIKCVDSVKDRIANEGDLNFVGGKLNFTMSDNAADNVSVSFELYFQDAMSKWHKAAADNDIPTSLFTLGALDELREKGTISYEVE